MVVYNARRGKHGAIWRWRKLAVEVDDVPAFVERADI
jgi:hypothetical protein